MEVGCDRVEPVVLPGRMSRLGVSLATGGVLARRGGSAGATGTEDGRGTKFAACVTRVLAVTAGCATELQGT